MRRLVLLLFLVAGLGHAPALLALACSSIAGGNWSAPATWGACGGVVPGAADTATINATHTVTLNQDATVRGITVNGGGILQLGNDATVRTLTVFDPTAAAGFLTTVGTGIVRTNAASNTTHAVFLEGNLTNAGTFNMATDANSLANVTLNGGGAQTVSGAGATMQFVDLTIGSAGVATFSRSFSLSGNMSDNGNFSHTGAASRVTFNGTAARSLLGAAANTTFQNATMANTAAVANRSLTLSHDMTVVTNLTFAAGAGTGGRIITGASKVVIQAAGAAAISNACPTDANDYVAGNLQRFVAAGGPTVAFPVGTDGAAAPALACSRVSITFAGVAAGGGRMIVFATQAEHPQIATSGLDAANSLNRYWTFTTTGVSGVPLPAFTTYGATFNWVAGDIDGAPTNPLAFIATRYTGGVWNPTGEGAVTATSLIATGMTALGEFAIGEVLGYNGALGRFNAYDTPPTTPAGSVHGNLRTELAGVGFSLRIVHLNIAGTALQNFTGNVTVDLMNASDNSGAIANNCRATWTVIRSVTINFPGGGNFQTVNFTGVNTENNSWKEVRIRATSGAQQGCSGDAFAIRPQNVTIAASDATWTTAGTARALTATAFNGAPAHKAGQPFTVRVGQTVAGQANNFFTAGGHTGTPSVRTLTCTNPTGGAPVCTGCAAGTLTLGAFTPGIVGPLRVLDANTASYTEAGTFSLDIHDTAYAQIDAADTPATYSNLAPIGRFVPKTPAPALAVGRFVPDNFLVATNNVPQFQTFGSSCAARSFTYVGQPFGYVATFAPQVLVTARDAAGNTTTNYRECVWKITTGAPSDVTQTYNNVAGPVIDASLATNAPAIAPGNGTGTVTVSALDRIAYTRSPTTPLAPFNANITLGVSVRDDSEPDGQIASNTATFDGGGTGITFDLGIDFRYGRLRMLNALGSEKIDLPIPLEAQYWMGTGFSTNTADNCTTLLPANFTLSNYQGSGCPASCPINATNMDNSHIAVGGAFVAGVGSLTLTKPLPAPPAPGSVDICLDLGADVPVLCSATSAAQTWLQNRNTGTDYDDDPVARAAFGLYGAQPRNFIFFRENY